MEFIDNHPVVGYRVRFHGRAEYDETHADHVRDGDIVIWLVRARCHPPQYLRVNRDSDERYRFSIQEVEQAAPLTGEPRDAALTYLDHGADQGFLVTDPDEPTLPLDLGIPHHGNGRSNELDEIRALLADIGELHDGTSVVDNLRRVLERRRQPEPEPPTPPSFDLAPTGDGVEVVGTVYGRPNRTHQLLRDTFGD